MQIFNKHKGLFVTKMHFFCPFFDWKSLYSNFHKSYICYCIMKAPQFDNEIFIFGWNALLFCVKSVLGIVSEKCITKEKPCLQLPVMITILDGFHRSVRNLWQHQ